MSSTSPVIFKNSTCVLFDFFFFFFCLFTMSEVMGECDSKEQV